MKVLNVILSVLIVVIICSQMPVNGVKKPGLDVDILEKHNEIANRVESKCLEEGTSKTHADEIDFDTVGLLSRTKQLSDSLVQRDLEVAQDRKWNDLHLAALWGLEQEVISLTQGVDYNVNTLDAIESTPLHLAVARGNTACARVLLENGAKVDAQDAYGWTPLHTALFHLSNMNHPCVKLLEEYGASISIKNSDDDTPWDLRKIDRSWR